MEKDATLSIDGTYRYSLTRKWNPLGPSVCWVMLNPSTADADIDDPTIRRCIRFSQDWGYASMEVVNLFALRATNPKELLTHPQPIGEMNRYCVGRAMDRATRVVAAWGANKAVSRNPLRHDVEALNPFVLGVTKNLSPKHPLYVRADTKPVTIRSLVGMRCW